jgi:alanyl-tRNA synthetase
VAVLVHLMASLCQTRLKAVGTCRKENRKTEYILRDNYLVRYNSLKVHSGGKTMTTEKLYYADPYLREFTAHIVEAVPLDDGSWSVILDCTAFYPEGGGQPCDTGCLDDIPVIAVREDGGEIVHVTAAKPKADVVAGRINWSRRFDHMQQHSGEHLLSAAFAQLFAAENIGFHLSAESVSIDVTLGQLNAEQITAVENHANVAVFANVPIRAHNIAANYLDQFALRKPPAKNFNNLRLIEILGQDCCPCGGTHVAATGEIGLIKIRSWERKAGAVRVDFVCGQRALADYSLASAVALQLSGLFSVPPAEVPAAVERQLAKADMLHKTLQSAKQELLRYHAADLYTQAEWVDGLKMVVKTLADVTPAELADLARQLLLCGPVVALLGTANARQNKSHLLFACTPGTGADMGTLLKAVLPTINGKGGGNTHWSQGGGCYFANLEEALAMARQTLFK